MKDELYYQDSVFVPDNWSCKRLVDCTTDNSISYGIVQPGQHQNNGVPVIRINNINGGQLDLIDVLKVSPEIESKYHRTRLSGGEVLLTLVGSTGQSLVVPKELKGWNVPRAIAVIRPKEDIGSEWINICLQSKETKHFLDVRANTTVQKTLNLKDVRDIPILIPPKEVKNNIEYLICSLNKKIAINNKINENLEQLAQAIFKSWFVDFDPVKAKARIKERIEAEGGDWDIGLTETAEELGLSKDVLALFPDKFEESEFRLIPKGWKVKATERLAEKIAMGPFGSNIKVSTFVDAGVPIISGQHLKETLVIDQGHNFITDSHAIRLENSIVHSGDIIFT